MSSVCRRDSGCDAFCGIDRDGEGCFMTLAVFLSHGGEVEGFCALGGDGGANKTTSMVCHKCDRLSGDERGGSDEVGFVFTARVICYDDKASRFHFVDDFLNGGKL